MYVPMANGVESTLVASVIHAVKIRESKDDSADADGTKPVLRLADIAAVILEAAESVNVPEIRKSTFSSPFNTESDAKNINNRHIRFIFVLSHLS